MPFRTENKGWGLRTLENLTPQQFVFEYWGEVINNETCRQRLEANPGEDNFYYITLDRSECIDASKVGNLARFMNHSCEPNCQTQKWVVNGELRIGLFSKYDVPAGTELTFDYNFERFGSKKQKCYCGCKNCRGYLGAKPKHFEAELKKKNGKRKPTTQAGRAKRAKPSTSSGDLTLEEQNWGLPPPPKKARHNYIVDHAQYVTALLDTENEVISRKPSTTSRPYLPRNIRVVHKHYLEVLKTCVASALSSNTRKSKAVTPKSPSVSSLPSTPLASPPPSENGTPESPNLSISPQTAIKKEGPVPISARRRKRKVPTRYSPKILDILHKIGVTDSTPLSGAKSTSTDDDQPQVMELKKETDDIVVQ